MTLGAGGFNLGNAYGKIILDPSGVDSGMAQARAAFDNGLQSMGAGLQNLGNSITGIGGRLTLLTAPLTLFGKQGLDAASNFQDAMTEIQVRARLSADEMERVRQKALEMGADTVFSAGQSAEAFLQLLTTGQSVEEAMQTIGAVMAGAAASGSDLGYVADAVTDIMAQFNLEAAQSADVVNALAKAAGASSATMDDLIQGFQNVGGVANSFNLSIDDTAAILATFSENGIKASEGGTQLRSMLNNMMRPTEGVQKAWQRLGTSLFDSTGKMRPLNAVIADMNRGMATMTEQQRLETIQELAGTYGQLGLTALLNADGFGAMTEAMDDATDAQDVAEAKMKTFSGSVENLRGSIETLQINALTPLMDEALAPIVGKITEVVNAINDWMLANPEVAGQIVQILALVVAAGPVLIGLGVAINLIGTALSGLGTILAVLTSPITLIIAAIAGITLALDALGIIDLDAIFGPIGRFLEAVAAGVNPFDAFVTLIGDLFGTQAEQTFLDALQSISTFVNDAIASMQGFVSEHAEFLVALGAISIAVGVITGVLWLVSAAIGGVTLATGALTVALGILFSPVVLLAAGIAGLIWLLHTQYEGGLAQLLRDAATAAQQLAFIFTFVLWKASEFVRQKIAELLLTILNVINEINNLKNALSSWGTIPGQVTTAGSLAGQNNVSAGDFLTLLKNAIVAQFAPKDSGGQGVADMPYLIGRGAQPELFVPDSAGTFIPNADRMMGGDTYNVTIAANTYEGGVAAARGFEDEMRFRRRSRG